MPTSQQWDIVSGVGITALAVAVGRAIETQRDNGLVDDPYAAALVHAAEPPIPLPEDTPEDDSIWEQAADYLGVRSCYFDTWFRQACSEGVQQAVILASGLDTRAFRMSWPSEFRVFEVDQPKVLDFKDSVLDRMDVRADCDRRTVGVDLREDWSGALKNAGFDTGLPTAWLAEGLLPYLPADAERELLATVHGFSAPGSQLAVESLGDARARLTGSVLSEIAQRWGIDLAGLMSDEQRPEPAEQLAEHGWTVTGEPLGDVASGYGRTLGGFSALIGEHGRMLTARLPS